MRFSHPFRVVDFVATRFPAPEPSRPAIPEQDSSLRSAFSRMAVICRLYDKTSQMPHATRRHRCENTTLNSNVAPQRRESDLDVECDASYLNIACQAVPGDA
jgi:hypothetical protein